jgi:hypothetical protein
VGLIDSASPVGIADVDLAQVKNWFKYQRRKIRKDCAVPEDQMLLAQGEDGASARQVVDREEDDMLFSPATDNTPSLTSQSSSVASSAPSTGEKKLALKRPSPDDDTVLPDKLKACDLGEAAIHILTSGYVSRGLRGPGGIQVEKPPPILSLARLAPSTFCPGFKEVRFSSTFHPLAKGMFHSPWHTTPISFHQYPIPSLSLGPEIFNHQF